MRFVKHIENERGMALVTTMLFLVILFFLGVAAYMMTSSDLRISGYYRLSQKAFYVAESGIEEARGRLRNIYLTQFINPGGAAQNEDWRYYIGDSDLAGDLGYDSGDSDHTKVNSLSDSDMIYAVELRFKTGSDPNSAGITDADQIIYWGDIDDDGVAEESDVDSADTYPIFIATSLGAKSDARKKIVGEIRGVAIFADAPAALFVNGDLTKNGSAGTAQGAWGSWWPGSTCPAVPDVMTTVNATTSDAQDWLDVSGAGTSADGPIPNHPLIPPQPPEPTDTPEEWLVTDVSEDYYPFADVVAMASSNYDQKVTSGNNLTFGTYDNPGIFYSDTDLSANGLNGYGVLVVGKLDANGNPDTSINFTVGGNIEWHGLIVATGQTIFNGGGVQQIYGAMVANAVTTVNGQPDFLYDCTFLNTLKNRSPNFQVYSWKEDL